MRPYYVYATSTRQRRLHLDATINLLRRIQECRGRAVPGCHTRLVYYERHGNRMSALVRLRQLRRWPRGKKTALIASANADWRDLSGQFIRSLPTRKILEALWPWP